MKIRYNGHTSFTISVSNLIAVTDIGLAKSVGVKGLPKEFDVVINTVGGKVFEGKAVNRDKVFEINTPGEYEIAGLMVQRPVDSSHYVIDYDLIRVLYIGEGSAKLDIKQLRDLGDVDVLLLPYSDGDSYPSFDLIQEIIAKVEPIVLVPYGTVGDGGKSKEDFIKHFGFVNSTEEKVLKVESKPEADQRNMRVIFLDK